MKLSPYADGGGSRAPGGQVAINGKEVLLAARAYLFGRPAIVCNLHHYKSRVLCGIVRVKATLTLPSYCRCVFLYLIQTGETDREGGCAPQPFWLAFDSAGAPQW